ncbi:hypothetical protein M0811_10742 [Anaeramoeba ignava]|uniref:FLYWCH-type domain-containing protein n=1 Tax=Anaeramoeba ignava TaxID=1746090 RepID=A0A9Q0LD45_ANAIG|nr:hypothetical protein M0811_10742 [Anaeramoeba ignava]
MSNRLIFEGKIYRLKWNNVERSTKYWSCLFPGCNGTIVEKNGQLIPGRPHSEDCSSPERSEMEAKSLFWAVKKITEKMNGKNEKFEIPPQQEVLSYISHKRKKIFPYDHLRIVSSYPYSKTKDGYQFWRFTSEILISGKKEIAMFWFSDFVSRPFLEANRIVPGRDLFKCCRSFQTTRFSNGL